MGDEICNRDSRFEPAIVGALARVVPTALAEQVSITIQYAVLTNVVALGMSIHVIHYTTTPFVWRYGIHFQVKSDCVTERLTPRTANLVLRVGTSSNTCPGKVVFDILYSNSHPTSPSDEA